MRLAERLPDCLASPAARARVVQLAASLPGGASARILELRLDGLGRMVDLSLAFSGPGLPALAASARQDPTLAALSGVLGWAAEGLRSRSLWLEWDLPDQGAGAPALPSLFLAPAQDLPGAGDYWERALPHLGKAAGLTAFRQVHAAIGQAGATLRQLGAMLSRPDAALRLVIDTPSPKQALGLVTALRPDRAAPLRHLLALPGFAEATRLDLDLDPAQEGLGIGPRLSLELPAIRQSPQDQAATLTALAKAGVISSDAAQALVALAPWQALCEGVRAGLNHLKASIDPWGGIEVKAYLGLVDLRPFGKI